MGRGAELVPREISSLLTDELDRILGGIADFNERTLECALKLHRKACMQGRLRGIWSSLAGVDRRLMDLNSLRQIATLIGWRYVGMQEIAIDKIVGSEGFCDVFDDAFYPLHGHDEVRWLQTAIGSLSKSELTPIEVVQVDSSFYAQTGQYQISVGRAMGMKSISAFVTSWEI
jgi:hypothetical protein